MFLVDLYYVLRFKKRWTSLTDYVDFCSVLHGLQIAEYSSKHRGNVKKTLNEMITVASTLEEYRYISSIDGIGPNLAARIIAEIGDIEEFKSREALVAYAGLDPHIYQSGDQDGKHLKISKKGNKYLRCLLFLAVGCSIRGAKDNPVNRFYQKKKQQSNPLNSKAAKTACTAKLLKNNIRYMQKQDHI